LTGRENIRMIGGLYGIRRRELTGVSDELLEQFSIADAADRPVKSYSGGCDDASICGEPAGQSACAVSRRAHHGSGSAQPQRPVGVPRPRWRGPQVRAAAKRRLDQAADVLVQRLLKFALDGNAPDTFALTAIRDALDRAGLGAKQTVAVEVKAPWEELLGDVAHSNPRSARGHEARRTAAPSATRVVAR
jgi:hypothetical protein